MDCDIMTYSAPSHKLLKIQTTIIIKQITLQHSNNRKKCSAGCNQSSQKNSLKLEKFIYIAIFQPMKSWDFFAVIDA